jgi:hypothetical protein
LRGVLIFCRDDLRKKKVCNWVPGRFEPRDSNGGDEIPARRITDGEGKVGEKVQELTAGSGAAGVEEGRCRDGDSTENGASAVRSQGGGGVPVAGVQEGGKEVARKLSRIDVVLVVSSVRAKRGSSSGKTVRLSDGGEEDRQRGVLGGVSARGWRRTGYGASVGCGGAREAPGADVGQQSWLTAASRECGIGLAPVLSGEEAKEAKCRSVRV